MSVAQGTVRFFNNPLFSDITIKQIYNGQVREYHAHKVVLCSRSQYFAKALTGGFKEAEGAVMEIHDDVPDHFEVFLEFMYSDGITFDSIKRCKGSISERAKLSIALHAMADKYVAPQICDSSLSVLKWQLEPGLKHNAYALVKIAVDEHYGNYSQVGSPVGEAITSSI